MPRQKQPQTTSVKGKRGGRSVYWAPEGSHPSQVSGLFKDDPTCEEFTAILRQQREEDYRRTNAEIDAIIHPTNNSLRHRSLSKSN